MTRRDTRAEILAMVRTAPKGGIRLTEITAHLGLHPSTIRHQADRLVADRLATFAHDAPGVRRGRPRTWLCDPARLALLPDYVTTGPAPTPPDPTPGILAHLRAEPEPRTTREILAAVKGTSTYPTENAIRTALATLAADGTLEKRSLIDGTRGKPAAVYCLPGTPLTRDGRKVIR